MCLVVYPKTEVQTKALTCFLQEMDIDYVFTNAQENIPQELETELKKRYEDFVQNPQQGIFLEDLKRKVMTQRYGISSKTF